MPTSPARGISLAVACLLLASCGASESEPPPGDSDLPACAPGYSKCLDPELPDYDCVDGTGDGPGFVEGPVEVTGSDPYDLDRDGNGTGC